MQSIPAIMGTLSVELTITTIGSNQWNKTIEKRVSGLTKKAYGWSKWGGKNYGLVQESKTPDWKCQACGETQGNDLPSYMFEFLPNEFVRICTLCQHKKLLHHIEVFKDLLELVRHPEDTY